MAYRDSTTSSGSSATPSVTVPVGVQSGDIVIVAIDIDNASAAVDPADLPSGFTELAEVDVTFDGQTTWVGWKRLSGADTGSYTFGNLGASGDWVCQAIALSGRHATNPPVVSATATGSTGASPASIAANGVTAVAGDDLVWVCAPDVNADGTGNGTTPPSTFTEAEDAENAWSNLSLAYKENVSAGATGTITGQFAFTASTGWATWLVRVPAGSVAADATVTAPPALSAGSVAAPSVTGSNPGTVIAVPAVSSGDAPAASIVNGAAVSAVPATAAGSAPPANQIVSAVINAPAVSCLGTAVPAAFATTGATVAAVVADCAGSAPVAVIQSGATVAGVAAVSVGDGAVASVLQGGSVIAVPAISMGSALRPLVTPAPSGAIAQGLVAATFAEGGS